MSPALAPHDRQFLPTRDLGAELSRSVTRACTAMILNAIKSPNERPERIIEDAWPADRTAVRVVTTRGATAPATTTQASWAAELAATGPSPAFLANLTPSAASRLFAQSLALSLAGMADVRVPFANLVPSLGPSIVAEGAPIPVRQAGIATVLLRPKKLAAIALLTSEIAQHSTPNAENVVRQVMIQTAAVALDREVFASTGGGLLAGATPITPATGGGAAAAAADVGALVGAIAAAGGGASIMFIADYATAARLQMFTGPGFTLPVYGTSGLAAKTLAAIDAAGVVSGVGSETPRIDIGRETVVHMEDTTPLQFSSGPAGSPTLAAPMTAMYQHDTFALRLVLPIAFAARPGFAQVVTNVSW